MRYCSHCNEIIIFTSILRFNTSDCPVEQEIEPTYCPICACKLTSENMPRKWGQNGD